jgi:hypothetical protein
MNIDHRDAESTRKAAREQREASGHFFKAECFPVYLDEVIPDVLAEESEGDGRIAYAEGHLLSDVLANVAAQARVWLDEPKDAAASPVSGFTIRVNL